MLEKYRKTMSGDILHSWAEDAQNKIDLLTKLLLEIHNQVEETYGWSEEGRSYLKKINDTLNV